MAAPFEIEPLGDHAYLVRGTERGETVESRFRVARTVLEELGVDDGDEPRVVAETAAFLAERQQIVDFPQLVDLEDLPVRYEDYVSEVTGRLNHPDDAADRDR
jgi:hypothetical protein